MGVLHSVGKCWHRLAGHFPRVSCGRFLKYYFVPHHIFSNAYFTFQIDARWHPSELSKCQVIKLGDESRKGRRRTPSDDVERLQMQKLEVGTSKRENEMDISNEKEEEKQSTLRFVDSEGALMAEVPMEAVCESSEYFKVGKIIIYSLIQV